MWNWTCHTEDVTAINYPDFVSEHVRITLVFVCSVDMDKYPGSFIHGQDSPGEQSLFLYMRSRSCYHFWLLNSTHI